MSTILVIQPDAGLRRTWRQEIERGGHRTIGAPSLLQGLTAITSARPAQMVMALSSQQEVDILRYVASLRDLPPLIAVTDGELPPLPARVQAATLLMSPVDGATLRRALDDVRHACTLGEPPPSRHPFRLPPEGVSKWCFTLRGEAPGDDETIPRSEFAA